MMLVATGSGWNLEEPVSIPPRGDPEPVCLNPPCRASPATLKTIAAVDGCNVTEAADP